MAILITSPPGWQSPPSSSTVRPCSVVKTYFLQMTSSDDMVASTPLQGLCLRVIDPPDGAVNRRFYQAVGGTWNWTACADWDHERWNAYLASNPVSTVVLVKDGEEIGYGEMINRAGDVEILSFGLLPAFIGKGLGGPSLELVIRFAWTIGNVHHLWLHTCDNDHPSALDNYRRRGFSLYDTQETDIPEPRPGC